MGFLSFMQGSNKSKSQSTQESYNRSYDDISAAFKPLLGMANTGATGLNQFLSGDTSGFNTYKNNTGFDFLLGEGFRGIQGDAAARRMVRSGDALKSLQAYGTNLQSTFADKYLAQLLAQAQIGLGAGSAITDAGSVSKSQSTSEAKNGKGLFGLLKGLGSLAAAGG